MKICSAALTCLLLAASPVSGAASAGQTAAASHGAGIDWQKGDVDAAFALAKTTGKPLFLYWGASWCPPCNQVKATIFNRQDFIEKSRFFVPVYIDGDSPGAQKLGDRYKVRGYPSMILFKPDGSEITRLPGEVDAARYLQVLTLGMNASHSVKDLLQAALGGSDKSSVKLGADDWRLLAHYSWDTDEQQLLEPKMLAATLERLAQACPPGDSATRLGLNALVAEATGKSGEAAGTEKAAAPGRLLKVLADTQVARDNMDLLINYAAGLSGFVSEPQSAQRAQLAAAFGKALQRLAADQSLSKNDRLTALAAQVALARLDRPKGGLAPALLREVRQRVEEADGATSDGYERQSVISTAAHTLSEAGLLDESDRLLRAELKRSHSPYYFMLSLASNAKKRGDKPAALNWYEQAYAGAKGPATRLQWGSTYLRGLIELAPGDEARIEKTAKSVLNELSETPDAFYERNRSALEKIGDKLTRWNGGGKHQDVFQRIQMQLNGICAKLPAGDVQRASCQSVLDPARLPS